MNGAEAEVTDVLVVGAGPAGLALAISLRLHGLSVRVIDQSTVAKHQPRAAVVWPGEAAILDALGVLDPFQAEAVSLRTVAIHVGAARIGSLDVDTGASRQPTPMVIEQHRTEALMTERLRGLGVEIEWSTPFESLDQDNDGVTAGVSGAEGGRSLRARWLVGCDGAHSSVRRAAGIDFPGRARRNLECVQINARVRWRHGRPSDSGWYFLRPNASLGVFPLSAGGYRFFCFKTDDTPDRRDPPTVAEMRDLIARMTGAPDLELEPTEPLWLNRARFQDRVATTLVGGRVLLAGDAAHVWSAVGGHGMNVALQDAFALGWRLAAVKRDGASAKLLDTYSREQRARAFDMIRAIRLDVLERPPHPAAMPLLRAGLPILLRSRTLQRRVMRVVGDTDLRHRRGPLVVGGPGAGALATAVAPTAWRLSAPSELLAGALKVAQAYAVPISEKAAGSRLQLLRPDGYVGLDLDGRDLARLEAYLARWFSRRKNGGLT